MKITSLKSLQMETERIRFKIKMDKEKIVTDVKLLKYQLIEHTIKEVATLFKGEKHKEESSKKVKGQKSKVKSQK